MEIGANQLGVIAVATLLGLVIGWFIHHWLQRGPIADLEHRVRQEENKLRRSDRNLQASKLEANRLRSEAVSAAKDRERLNRIQKELKEIRLEKEVLEIRLADRTRSLQKRDKRQISTSTAISGNPLPVTSQKTPSPIPKDSTPPEEPSGLAPLYSERPKDSDDLKKIRGIGRAIELKLNQLGIYNFEQIAHFSDDSIAWVARKIGAFPDRIGRDRWVEQAKAFQSKLR